jgi:hypothetical protein
MPDPDWALHGIVLGVVAAIGAIVTLIAFVAPSRSSIISLGPMIAFFLWIGLGVYAAVSSVTFGLFGRSWGALPSYLAAVPLAALPLAWTWRGREWLENSRRYREQKAELVKRFELLSWSRQNLEKGRLRLDSEIRALIDLDVEFEGYGTAPEGYSVTSVPEKPARIRVPAGQTARFSAILQYALDLPCPVGQVLQFITTAGDQPEGITLYDPKVDRDVSAGEMCVRRPLPPERPPV